jgi:hypothetical protein
MKSLTEQLSNGKAGSAYPKRPPYFAHRFCRLLMKTCAANIIGTDGCYLLCLIAHTEDSRRYKPPGVTFWNEQLVPITGFGSVDKLHRVRAHAVAAGWLHYEPGRKGRAALYWVTIPPALQDVGDGPIIDEESAILCRTHAEQSAPVCSAPVRKNPRGKCGRIREESAEHSSSSSSSAQRARSASDEEPAEFAKFWASYPLKENRSEALATWVQFNPGPELVAVIMAALAAAIRSPAWMRENGKSVPYPARWLREQRWRDKTPAAAQANGAAAGDALDSTLRWRERAAKEKETALSGAEIRDLLAKRWKAPPAANGSA